MAVSVQAAEKRVEKSAQAFRTISEVAHLLFVAKNIERIGDHATNVAEMVYFAATGQYLADRDTDTAEN